MRAILGFAVFLVIVWLSVWAVGSAPGDRVDRPFQSQLKCDRPLWEIGRCVADRLP